ncbi:MAG: hypothetical protein AAGF67_10070, partial [Verrucomicrobiota bacterium]
ITQHDEELLRGARIAEDPRRVFEDHEAATLSTQAVMLDIVRACGFPEAAATHSPGMVLLDREADWENAAFLHTCTAEFIPLSGLSGGGCGIGMIEGASAKDIPILNDTAFLTLWLLQQKNQITEVDWPEKIVPYLETLVELSADDVGSQAELALFQLTQNGSTKVPSHDLGHILTKDPGSIDPGRIMRILEFSGFDVNRLLASQREVMRAAAAHNGHELHSSPSESPQPPLSK